MKNCNCQESLCLKWDSKQRSPALKSGAPTLQLHECFFKSKEIALDKFFFHQNVLIFLQENIYLGYSQEAPWQGTSY